MNSTQKHAYPRYDEICNILDYGAHIGKMFPVSFCQNLLEQIETCAQQVQEMQSLPQVKAVCLELIGYLHTLPYRNRAEREARTSLLERAERILMHDTNDPGTTSRPEATE